MVGLAIAEISQENFDFGSITFGGTKQLFTRVKNLNMKTKKNNVKISYDPEADVLSMEADKKTPIAYAQEMGNLVVHFSKSEQPVLVEVLEVSKSFRNNRRFITPLRNLVTM